MYNIATYIWMFFFIVNVAKYSNKDLLRYGWHGISHKCEFVSTFEKNWIYDLYTLEGSSSNFPI